MPVAILLCGIRPVARRRNPLVLHVFIDLVDRLFEVFSGADDRQKLAEGFGARGVALPSTMTARIFRRALRPRVHERVGFVRTVCIRKAVRCIRKHVRVCHAVARASPRIFDIGEYVAEECRREADDVALAMAYDGNGYVGLHLADRLDQFCQPQGREHAIRTRRRTIQRPVGRIDALHRHPSHRSIVQTAVPKIRQARTAIRERAATPIVLLVQKDLVAVLFEFFARGPITPPEVNDGRKRRIRLDIVVRQQLRVQEPIRRHALRVLRRRQLPGFDAVIHHLIVESPEPAIETLAQSFLRRIEPFALRVHAMHEDHDTGQGHLQDADKRCAFHEPRHSFDATDDDRRRFGA